MMRDHFNGPVDPDPEDHDDHEDPAGRDDPEMRDHGESIT